MDRSINISHKGIIEKTDDSHLFVRIQRDEGCGNCSAQKKCAIGASSDTLITIPVRRDMTFSAGESCTIQMKRRAGVTAVLLAYLIPFILLISVLLIAYSITNNETAAALISISCLAPYYFLLYLMRKTISRKFDLVITK